MCELTPTPYLAFLLPKKDGPRKKEPHKAGEKH